MCTHTLSLCLSLFLSLSLSLSLYTLAHTHTGSWVTARSRGDTSWHCHKPPSHYLFPPGPLDSETVSGGTRKEGGVEGRHRPEERAENQATGPVSRSLTISHVRARSCMKTHFLSPSGSRGLCRQMFHWTSATDCRDSRHPMRSLNRHLCRDHRPYARQMPSEGTFGVMVTNKLHTRLPLQRVALICPCVMTQRGGMTPLWGLLARHPCVIVHKLSVMTNRER